MARVLRNRIEIEQELISETDSDEAVSTDNESELDEHNMAVEITFGQNYNIHGILVVSILSLEVSVD
jgi:hypothetical protein